MPSPGKLGYDSHTHISANCTLRIDVCQESQEISTLPSPNLWNSRPPGESQVRNLECIPQENSATTVTLTILQTAYILYLDVRYVCYIMFAQLFELQGRRLTKFPLLSLLLKIKGRLSLIRLVSHPLTCNAALLHS